LCIIRVLMKTFQIKHYFTVFCLLFCCQLFNPVLADVVKPALVEINVEKNKTVNIEVRASIEALLTGINAQYKNTKQSPNAEQYDVYRKMPSSELQQSFEKFKQPFLQSVSLQAGTTIDNNKILLTVESVDIPPPGYTKVPRISTLRLSGKLPESAQSLQWYYPAKFGDHAVRVRQIDKENQLWHWSQWQWIRDDSISEPFSLTEIVAKKSVFDVIWSYMSIGFAHIVPKGLDHILFILGLFLLSTHWRPLLWQVTMFTVAHTITLGLAMNNVVELPANIVEPLIALSIAYVGIENVLARQLHKSRLILVFIFGLLHGLGFASVLSDFGMPQDDFVVALLSFNVGVEFGQLAVLLLAYLLLSHWFKDGQLYRKTIVIPGSILISVVGFYWFIERLELF